MKRKTFAIMGLGIFGSTVAKTLSEYGYDVIGMDLDLANVDRVAEYVTQAVQADFTDIEQLRMAGVSDVDVAIIATGSKLEASIMAVLHLKELGVPFILAKAKNKVNMQILLKIGADRVIRPEKEMGERVAKSLLSQNIIDLVDIDDEYSMMELQAPKDWIGKALKDLDLRARYGVNVLGYRSAESAKLNLSIGADYIISEEDLLLVIVENKKFESLEYQGKI
jgi:trk system potassium uptake protein